MNEPNKKTGAVQVSPAGVAPAANAIVNYHASESLGATMLKSRLDEISAIVKDALILNTHYGIIPGTDGKTNKKTGKPIIPKKVLWKSGAEALCVNFGFRPDYIKERFDLSGNHKMYEITCDLIHIESGIHVGRGIGSCNSKESKYSWDPNPANVYNTILKMAKKRAFVDAVLSATAASDAFEQDVDEDHIAESVGLSVKGEEAVKLAKAEPAAAVSQKVIYPAEPVGHDTRYMDLNQTGKYANSGKVALRESAAFYKESVLALTGGQVMINLITDQDFRSYCACIRVKWPVAWYGDGQEQAGFRFMLDKKAGDLGVNFENDPAPAPGDDPCPPAAADMILDQR